MKSLERCRSRISQRPGWVTGVWFRDEAEPELYAVGTILTLNTFVTLVPHVEVSFFVTTCNCWRVPHCPTSLAWLAVLSMCQEPRRVPTSLGVDLKVIDCCCVNKNKWIELKCSFVSPLNDFLGGITRKTLCKFHVLWGQVIGRPSQ